MKYIDNFLNKITMYRLVLSILLVYLLAGFAISFFGLLPFSPWDLLYGSIYLAAVCYVANEIFVHIFDALPSVESWAITALILSLIINPGSSLEQLIFLTWAGVLAMASKYILAVNRKHLFNPAAMAVVLTAIGLEQSASWWIGSRSLVAFTVIGGWLIVRKLKKSAAVFSFLGVALVTIVSFSALKGTDFWLALKKTVLDSPIIFFGTIMLTEPFTLPPTQAFQWIYGALVGFLFAPQIHIGSFYTTPELALIFGNLYSFIVSPKEKPLLTLKAKEQLAPNTYRFIFSPERPLGFTAGQYMEWTVPHRSPDARGNRRYFTIASSPTEDEVELGVKFYQPASTFKKAMLALKPGSQIIASQLAGDFTLPNNPHQPCVFIAGGIGVTPFRSMVKYLVDTKQSRPITLFYANKTKDDIVYADLFTRAKTLVGLKTIYTVDNPSAGWSGQRGPITDEMIRTAVPDYEEAIYYISGSHGMVENYRKLLLRMGIGRTKIKTDYFPGLV